MALRKNNQKDYDNFSDTKKDVLGNSKPKETISPGDTIKVFPNQDLPEKVLPIRSGGTAIKYEPEDTPLAPKWGGSRYMKIDTTGVPVNKKSGMVEEFGGWDTDEKGKLRDPKGGLYFVEGENIMKKGRKKPN